jgi:hypothetical protein
MNTIKQTILSIGSKDIPREDYLKHLANVKQVLGTDAALCFGDACACEFGDKFYVEEPDALPMLWKRMLNLSKEEKSFK